MENPFVLKSDEYTRDLNVIKGYFDQNTHFLHRMTGRPVEDCQSFLRETLGKGGKFPLHDPKVHILRKESPGNRIKDETRLTNYIKEIVESNYIMSPTMTAYISPHELQSPSAKFVETGITGRKIAKNEMFAAEVAGDTVLAGIKNAEQNAKKIGINSLSGMHGFTGNILYVKSGHSSLTSMCRAATSYGNANNERLLTGSRHYWSATIAVANMMALITGQDMDQFEEAMDVTGLCYPTVEQTKECIHRSLEMYTRSDTQAAKVMEVIEKLTPIERAVVTYTGDLYHIAKFNDSFVRTLLGKIVEYDHSKDPRVVDDPFKVLTGKTFDGETATLATYLNAELVRGEDFYSMKDKGMVTELQAVAKAAYHIQNVVQEYFTFFRVFLTPPTLPPTVANVRDILRRTVLASDTDSTIFTTQEWVKWYTGTYDRTRAGDGIWYTMTYIACQCIIHVLAKLSTNLGVVPEMRGRLQMKNEYAFPVFTLTSRAKHYYAFMSAREGNVYRDYAMEIKGVALRSSVVPPVVIKGAQKLMKEVMHRADRGEQYELKELYHIVYKYEREIERSISAGEHTYLKSGQIQASYANMERSNYRHYIMWNEVFAPKYGQVAAPPYSVITVPLEINNKTDMKNWIDTVKEMDPEFGQRLVDFCVKYQREQIKTLMLPLSILSGIGMPKEVLCVINIRRLTYGILESFYMVLETLGVFQVDSKYVRLVSDIYCPDAEDELLPMEEPDDGEDYLLEEEEDDGVDYGDY